MLERQLEHTQDQLNVVQQHIESYQQCLRHRLGDSLPEGLSDPPALELSLGQVKRRLVGRSLQFLPLQKPPASEAPPPPLEGCAGETPTPAGANACQHSGSGLAAAGSRATSQPIASYTVSPQNTGEGTSLFEAEGAGSLQSSLFG